MNRWHLYRKRPDGDYDRIVVKMQGGKFFPCARVAAEVAAKHGFTDKRPRRIRGMTIIEADKVVRKGA